MENMKDAKKLNLEEMNTVSGGTSTECGELRDALYNSEHWKSMVGQNALTAVLGAATGGLGGVIRSMNSSELKTVLDGMGIEADLSTGLFGIGSKNNTYRDKETGAMLLHSEVIEYIKTGRKTW